MTPLNLLFFFLLLSTTHGIRLYYNDSATHTLTSSSYPSTNIFLSSDTTLELPNGATITAPSNGDDGGSAIRIDDATFIGVNGTIIGGANFGGAGITISSSRDSTAEASFGPGMTIYGGDAARNETTQGGDAVQVLQAGSRAVFAGGVVVAGRGCSREVCGVSYNGNAIKVIMGEVIVKGGSFDGDFYNLQGDMAVYGCVELKDGRIVGVLSDGSEIDVAYVGEEQGLEIVYDDSVCRSSAVVPETTTDPTSGSGRVISSTIMLLLSMAVSLAVAL